MKKSRAIRSQQWRILQQQTLRLEEIQQETSEAMRGARLQVRTAKVAEARTKLEHDRNALAQAEAAAREAEAAAAVARECAQSEADLKETKDRIATEQAAITVRFAKIAEDQVARDAKRASGARSAAALQVIEENSAAEEDMLPEVQIGRIEGRFHSHCWI